MIVGRVTELVTERSDSPVGWHIGLQNDYSGTGVPAAAFSGRQVTFENCYSIGARQVFEFPQLRIPTVIVDGTTIVISVCGVGLVAFDQCLRVNVGNPLGLTSRSQRIDVVHLGSIALAHRGLHIESVESILQLSDELVRGGKSQDLFLLWCNLLQPGLVLSDELRFNKRFKHIAVVGASQLQHEFWIGARPVLPSGECALVEAGTCCGDTRSVFAYDFLHVLPPTSFCHVISIVALAQRVKGVELSNEVLCKYSNPCNFTVVLLHQPGGTKLRRNDGADRNRQGSSRLDSRGT